MYSVDQFVHCIAETPCLSLNTVCINVQCVSMYSVDQFIHCIAETPCLSLNTVCINVQCGPVYTLYSRNTVSQFKYSVYQCTVWTSLYTV